MGCMGSKSPVEDTRPRRLLKLIVVGDNNVGKSSLVYRILTGEWTDTLDSTKVAEPFIKEATLDEQQVRTEVWDTVGLDKHRVTTPSAPIYRRVDACALAFDVTNKDTFSHVENWMKEVNTRDNVNRTVYILVGTKVDAAPERRAVSQAEAEALVKSLNLEMYIETSSKDGTNVTTMYDTMARLARDMVDKEAHGNLLG